MRIRGSRGGPSEADRPTDGATQAGIMAAASSYNGDLSYAIKKGSHAARF